LKQNIDFAWLVRYVAKDCAVPMAHF